MLANTSFPLCQYLYRKLGVRKGQRMDERPATGKQSIYNLLNNLLLWSALTWWLIRSSQRASNRSTAQHAANSDSWSAVFICIPICEAAARREPETAAAGVAGRAGKWEEEEAAWWASSEPVQWEIRLMQLKESGCVDCVMYGCGQCRCKQRQKQRASKTDARLSWRRQAHAQIRPLICQEYYDVNENIGQAG